jgi:tRNA-specific 2-thiouridylase
LDSPAAGAGSGSSGAARYVTAVDGDRVHVGPRSALATPALEADRLSWVAGEPSLPRGISAQVRYRGEPLPAAVEDLGAGRVRVRFPEQAPLGVACGQAVVFYDGDECLGGATITRTLAG